MVRKILTCLLAAFIFTAPPAAHAGPAASAGSVFTRGTVTLVQGEFRATLRVEIADTSAERALGLMYRAVLPEDAGMLFIYPTVWVARVRSSSNRWHLPWC